VEDFISLKLAAKIMGLKDVPTDPYLQHLIRETMTAMIDRYGIFTVKRYRARLLEDLRQLQSLL